MRENDQAKSTDYGCCINFSIERWFAWPPNLKIGSGAQLTSSPDTTSQQADLSFIDAMSRRRLSTLSRNALHSAHQVAFDCGSLPMVFASRHGDLTRSLSILNQLTNEEMPSPAAFSLSVHNATAGINSIACADKAPSTSIAAGEETLLWALCEAYLRLRDEEHILLVYADDPLPADYQAFADAHEVGYALALLMTRGNAQQISWQVSTGQALAELPLSHVFLAWLEDPSCNLQWNGQRLSIHGINHIRAH